MVKLLLTISLTVESFCFREVPTVMELLKEHPILTKSLRIDMRSTEPLVFCLTREVYILLNICIQVLSSSIAQL